MTIRIHACRFGRALWLAAGLVVLPAVDAAAEGESSRITVRVFHQTAPVRSAIVEAESTRAITDLRGEAQLTLATGSHTIRIERLGFITESLAVDVLPTVNRPIVVRLRDESLESQVVVVTATRSGTVVGDQPVRVEAVPGKRSRRTSRSSPGISARC